MQEALRRFAEEQDGIEMAEWAIAATLVALGVATTITSISGEIVNQLTAVLARLSL